MTSTLPLARAGSGLSRWLPRWPGSRLPRAGGGRPDPAPVVVPPLEPRLQILRATLISICMVTAFVLAHLLMVSPLQQRAAQQHAYDSFRADLAAGTAPLTAADLHGRRGDPVAYLEVPSIGLRQVVVEGTDSGSLYRGPGHRRDTALPGLAGTSVVMGRRSTYGGPFAAIDELEEGDVIHVTTGAGAVDYRVRGVRRSGDPVPPPFEPGGGRLVLATADGSALLPSGVVLVDADLESKALGAARPAVAPGALPPSERAMGVDTSGLWRLLLWLQALVGAAVTAVWAWHRWHRQKAWIVFFPFLLLVGLMTVGEAVLLLPNLT